MALDIIFSELFLLYKISDDNCDGGKWFKTMFCPLLYVKIIVLATTERFMEFRSLFRETKMIYITFVFGCLFLYFDNLGEGGLRFKQLPIDRI